MTPRQRARWNLTRNLPDDWRSLFAPIPGVRPSGKVRCLLCGADGWGGWGVPAPWQLDHIAGHPVRCEVCRRPFTGTGALAHHQRCKSRHSHCPQHTTVPEWANPFAA
jgi:hypothetical protein